MGVEERMFATKKTLSMLFLCTFCTFLAALEYHRGGEMTLGLLQWGSDRLLHSKGEENEEAAKRVLMISGGAEGGEEEGSVTGDTQGTCENAIISAQKKPSLFINVGRVAIRVLQMPFQTVLARLRKLFSKGEPSPESPPRPPHSRRGVFDMESLTDEQLQWVEEVYQPLIHMPGIPERGLAVRMAVDRECVARYFVAGQWKPSLRGKTTVDHVLRTIQWRERERVAHLGPEDVLAQARDGYLYVNGTDRVGRPLIYFSPAFQPNRRPEKAIQYLVYTLERALDLSRQDGVEAYSFIIDCSGFSLSNMPPINIIKQTFTLLHHHYPTRVGFITFLHTGSAFQFLWKMLTPLVSPMTRNKILFVPTGEEEKILLERVDPHELDRKYGGAKDFTFEAHDYFGVSKEEVRRLTK